MKRIVSFFVCAGAAMVALLVASPSSHGQGASGPYGDITGVTAGSGLSGGSARGNATLAVDYSATQKRVTGTCGAGSSIGAVGSDGTVTCNAAGGVSDGDKGDITVSSSGATWTIDNSVVTSAKLNITTTSCSAGNHVSAISSGGVGACTADAGITGTLTSGTMPVATSTGTVGDSTIVKSGSAYTLTGTLTVTSNFSTSNGYVAAGGSSGYVLANKEVYAGGGLGYITDLGAFGCENTTNATATCYFNSVGYLESTSQFRDWRLQNGKGADVISAVGSTKAVDFAGPITFNAANNVGNELTLSGTFVSNGTSNTIGNSDSDWLNSRATLAFSGTDVSVASGSCTATGEAQTFHVEFTAESTTCVVNLNRTFNSSPYCTFSAADGTAANAVGAGTLYKSAQSTTQTTFVNGAGAANADIDVQCPDRR